jgi:hypothetical protein
VEVCGRPGDPVRVGDVLFRVGYRTDRRWADARPLLEGAVVIGDTVPAPAPLTLDVIA